MPRGEAIPGFQLSTRENGKVLRNAKTSCFAFVLLLLQFWPIFRISPDQEEPDSAKGSAAGPNCPAGKPADFDRVAKGNQEGKGGQVVVKLVLWLPVWMRCIFSVFVVIIPDDQVLTCSIPLM